MKNLEQEVRSILRQKLDPAASAASVPTGVVRRVRLRRVMNLVMGSLGVLGLSLGTWWAGQALHPDSLQTPGPQAKRSPESTKSPTTDLCDSGPWSKHCPEADWARAVLKESGLELTGDTGSALVAKSDEADLYFWAFEGGKGVSARERALREKGYRPFREINGEAVFSDGIRLTWDTWGLLVWVGAGPTSVLADLTQENVGSLVRASQEVVYPIYPPCKLDSCNENELLTHAAEWQGSALNRAGLDYINDYRDDGGGGHYVPRWNLSIQALRPTRPTPEAQASATGYGDPVSTSNGTAVFGSTDDNSPVGYFYWRAGGVDIHVEITWQGSGASHLKDLKPTFNRLIEAQQALPYFTIYSR